MSRKKTCIINNPCFFFFFWNGTLNYDGHPSSLFFHVGQSGSIYWLSYLNLKYRFVELFLISNFTKYWCKILHAVPFRMAKTDSSNIASRNNPQTCPSIPKIVSAEYNRWLDLSGICFYLFFLGFLYTFFWNSP